MYQLPRAEDGAMFIETFTTQNQEGQRIIRTRMFPVTTDDPEFSIMMQIPDEEELAPRLRHSMFAEPQSGFLTGIENSLTQVINAITDIYPDIGDGDNAQNLTEEQIDIIKGIFAESNLPSTNRMINLVLRQIILQTAVKTPLAEEDFSKLTETTFQEIDQTDVGNCTICLDNYEPEDTVIIMNKCPHMFHKDCIETWLKKYNNNCPICRGDQSS